MADLMGTNVSALIVPWTTEDTYPTHDSTYGKGDWKSVVMLAERDAIPAARRTIGMPCYVSETNTVYQLIGGIENSNWEATFSSPDVIIDNPTGTRYYVSPFSGNDANDGLSDLQPFATLAKACSVVSNKFYTGQVTIQVNGTIPAGDNAVLINTIGDIQITGDVSGFTSAAMLFIKNIAGGSVSINQCNFTDGTSPVTIVNSSAPVGISNSTFTGSTVATGTAISASYSAPIRIEDCVFNTILNAVTATATTVVISSSTTDTGTVGNYLTANSCIIFNNTPTFGPTATNAKVELNGGEVRGPSDNLFSRLAVPTGAVQDVPLGLIMNTGGTISWQPISAQQAYEIYVDGTSTQTTEDGTMTFPYKTLQAAIDNAVFGAVIKVAPGEYVGDSANIPATLSNITILTDGVVGQYRAKIDGGITIADGATRIGIGNLEFDGNYTNNTTGLVYMSNVAINGATAINAGAYQRYDSSFFTGVIIADGFVDWRDCQSEDSSSVSVTGDTAAFFAKDCTGLNVIHSAGTVTLDGCLFTEINDFGVQSSSTTGALVMTNCNLLQADGTYAKITKTGTCPYFIGSVFRNASQDTLNGTRIPYGLQAVDIFVDYTPVNFTVSGSYVKDYLVGIDNALAQKLDKPDPAAIALNKTYGLIKDGNGDFIFTEIAGGNVHDLGTFPSEAALRAAHPTAEDGDFAIVLETNSVWEWDTVGGDWVDTAVPPPSAVTASQVSYVNGAITNVQEALDQLLYVTPTGSLTGGGTYEVGTTISSVVLNWSFNKPTVESQSLDNGIGTLDPALRTYTHDSQTITTDRTYTLTASDGTTTFTASTAIRFQPGRYWGVSAKDTLDNADVLAMNTELASNRNKSVTYNCQGGRYFYYIYEASYGDPVLTVGGLSYTDFVVTQMTLTNASGSSRTVNVVRSGSIQNASAIPVVFS